MYLPFFVYSQLSAMLDFTEYTKIFISLFAILDPIGIIPVIILFTAGMTAPKRARLSRLSSLAVCAILLVALLIGEPLLVILRHQHQFVPRIGGHSANADGDQNAAG